MRMILCVFSFALATAACIQPQQTTIAGDTHADSIVEVNDGVAEVDNPEDGVIGDVDDATGDDASDAPTTETSDASPADGGTDDVSDTPTAETADASPTDVFDETVGPDVLAPLEYILTTGQSEMTYFVGQSLRHPFFAQITEGRDSDGYQPVGRGVRVSFQQYIVAQETWQTLGADLETDEDGNVGTNYWAPIGSKVPVQFRLVVIATLGTPSPAFVTFTARPTAITLFATGALHSCAATRDELFCWGYNGPPSDQTGPRPMTADVYVPAIGPSGYARVNNPRMVPVPSPNGTFGYTLPAGAEITGLAVAGRTADNDVPRGAATCISIGGGAGPNFNGIWCVGSNGDNRLANNSNGVDAPNWTRVKGVGRDGITFVLAPADSLVAGTDHFCAVIVDASAPAVYCWGSNFFGQVNGLGSANQTLATTVNQPIESTFASVGTRVALSAGGGNTCLRTTSTVEGGTPRSVTRSTYCWGDNTDKQISGLSGATKLDPTLLSTDLLCSNNSATNEPLVSQVGGPLAVGRRHVCTTNEIVSLGGTTSSQAAAACGVPADSIRTACAGSNAVGQLGMDLAVTKPLTWARLAEPPVRAPAEYFVQLAAGDGFTCGLSQSGNIFCWGASESGQLGAASTSPQPTSNRLFPDGTKRFIRIWAVGKHACALETDLNGDGVLRDLYCWGDNTFGQSGVECAQSPSNDACQGPAPRKIVLY